MNKEDMNDWSLPVEVLLKIFRNVNDVKTLMNIKLVDKRFNAVVIEFADDLVKRDIKNGIIVR